MPCFALQFRLLKEILMKLLTEKLRDEKTLENK